MQWKHLLALVVCLGTIGVAAADDGPGHAEPQSVTATCAATSADVSWAAIQDSRLSGYDVYRKAAGDPDYVKANQALVTATQYTVSALSTGTAYQFAVVAVYTDGQSGLSTPASCTTG